MAKLQRSCFWTLLIMSSLWNTGNGVKDVPTHYVTAVVGDPVYLPCDITTTEVGDHVVLVLWYREDMGTPIYSVDARDRDFSIAERWSDDAVFANRAYFMPEKRPAELGVDHIRETDSGLYRCRVDFGIAQTRNSKVNLTVIVPPQRVSIHDEFGTERTSVVGPYAEGDSLLLRCDVLGGKPEPTVTWFRNNIALESPSISLPGSGVAHARSELTISSLTRSDLHSELSCKAVNNNKTQPLVATVHLDMNFGPLDVRILGANQPLSSGRRYDLLCQSAGSRPPAQLTWWRNGQRLDRTKETTSNDGNQTTSTLSFVASKTDAGKYLSCRAENPVVNEEPLEDGWRLEIQYLPETKVLLGTSLNPDTIREGTDVYFDCLISAHPAVYKVEWRHNGRILHHNVANGVIISNQSLVLQGVSRSTAGNYSCVGYNTEGDAESKPFMLNVMFAPTCKPNQTRVHGVAKQEKAQIQCLVDANPPEVQFRWTFNNSAESIDVAASHIARTGTASVVSYTPMTELDYGTLLCWATNRIGHQRVPCVYHIIAAGRPDQVHNCTITNISMTSFTIRCVEGFNGGLAQSFLLEVRESQTQDLKLNFSSPIPRFAAANLIPGFHYLVGVYSFNTKGRSEPVILQAATLRLPEKQLTSEKEHRRTVFQLTPTLTVVIGLVCALLVVALIVIAVLRFQCARNGTKDYKGTRSNQREGAGSPGPSDKSDSKDSGPDGNESDEKNPDVIPETVDSDDQAEFMRRRQHISTIEAPRGGSPQLSNRVGLPRSVIGGSVIGTTGGYALTTQGGYCTLRNNGGTSTTIRQELQMAPNTIPVHPVVYSQCTLPRHLWPSYSGTLAGAETSSQQHAPSSIQNNPQLKASQTKSSTSIPMHSLMTVATRNNIPPRTNFDSSREKIPRMMGSLVEEEATAETPLMVAKRESTV